MSVPADVLGGIEWRGSLPAPELAGNGGSGESRLELSASGQGHSSEQGDWSQTWQFKLSIPVALAQ
jgi:hypothetical protein